MVRSPNVLHADEPAARALSCRARRNRRHAAGLVGQLRSTKIETTLSAEAVALYGRLEQETGLSTGFKQCGSVTTAQTPERFEVRAIVCLTHGAVRHCAHHFSNLLLPSGDETERGARARMVSRRSC